MTRQKKNFLRLKSRVYVDLLVFLGLISAPVLYGCGPEEAEQKRINDSIAAAQKKQDSIAKAKADSTALAEQEKARLDSIARADSIAKAKQNQYKPKPIHVVTKYGVPANMRND